MTDKSQLEYRAAKCSICGISVRVPVGAHFMTYAGASVASARMSGHASYCSTCQLAFCAEHVVWKGIPWFFSTYCPNCDGFTGGMNDGGEKPPETFRIGTTIDEILRNAWRFGPPIVLCGAGVSADP